MKGLLIALGVGLATLGVVVASGASPASGSRPGFRILSGCKGFIVEDEPVALAYARAEGAAAPTRDWVPRIELRLFGLACTSLHPSEMGVLHSKHGPFIYRMLRAALQGGVSAGRFTLDDAQAVLDAFREHAASQGLEPGLFVPATMED